MSAIVLGASIMVAIGAAFAMRLDRGRASHQETRRDTIVVLMTLPLAAVVILFAIAVLGWAFTPCE